jgi:RecA/RadA recombinase
MAAKKTKKVEETTEAQSAPVPATQKLIDKLNAHFEKSVIGYASELEGQYLLRRPFDVTSLDIAFNGGLPAGGHCIFAGEKNAGKSYLAYLAASVVQQNYGNDAKIGLILSEVYDKAFMKNAGLKIAYTPKELAAYEAAYNTRFGVELTPAQRTYLQEQVGEVVVVRTGSTEEALQASVEMLKSNLFQLIIVDSLGGLESDEEQGKDMGDQSRAQMAKLLTQYTHKVMPLFYQTTVIFISHIAEVQNLATPYSRKWRIPGGKAKDHLSLATLYISKGEKIKKKISGKEIEVGKYINILTEKGKCGIHENIEVSVNFFWGDEILGIEPGINKYVDLYNTAAYWDVVKVGNTGWFELPDGTKAQGDAKFEEILKKNPGMYSDLREACFKAAKVVYQVK